MVLELGILIIAVLAFRVGRTAAKMSENMLNEIAGTRSDIQALVEEIRTEREERLKSQEAKMVEDKQQWEEVLKRSDERFEELIRELRRPYRRRR